MNLRKTSRTNRIATERRTEFHVSLKPAIKSSFAEQLNSLREEYNSLLAQNELTDEHLLYAKVFVSDYLNQKVLMEAHPFFTEILNQSALSIIEQPPLDGNKINILLIFVNASGIKKYKRDNTLFIELDDCVHIFQTARICGELTQGTEAAFETHMETLRQYGMNFPDNCVRTWLYVKDIDKDYAKVVKGRNIFFDRNGLNKDTHFIASTGIGGSGDNPDAGLVADFYSIKGLTPANVKYLNAPDYMNRTHEYGVAFERGVSITCAGTEHIFVSGTASIDRHGKCLHEGDVLQQLRRIFVNIEQLLLNAGAKTGDIMQMIVYLRDISDYEIVDKYISEHFAHIPAIIVQARVCRPQWLIEIECIAVP